MFHRHFAPVVWWELDATDYTKEVSFLLPHTEVVLPLKDQSASLRVCLDGPYGQEIAISQYGTVILAADGGGIAGVLPFALSLVSRKKHDIQAKSSQSHSLYCDEVRKVDIYWKLDNYTQVNWTLDYFHTLANLGKATRKIFQMWVIYPGNPPIETGLPKEPNWIPVSGSEGHRISDAIQSESRRTPGKTIVITSGSAEFTKEMRNIVRANNTQGRIVKFCELEYRPSTTYSQSDRKFNATPIFEKEEDIFSRREPGLTARFRSGY
ncbi:hypothetical protein V8F33_012905 [Rhypophila sp. PSN 637]